MQTLTHIKGFQYILAGLPTLLNGPGGNTTYDTQFHKQIVKITTNI